MERRRGDLLLISERLGGHSIDGIHAQPDDCLAEIIRRHEGHLMREAISAHQRQSEAIKRQSEIIRRHEGHLMREAIGAHQRKLSRYPMRISRNPMRISRNQTVTSAVGSLSSALLKRTRRVAEEATCWRMRSSCSGITVNNV